MKKLIALLLALVMVTAVFVGCNKEEEKTGDNSGEKAPAAQKANLEGTMEELVGKIIEKNPVEFMGGPIPVDLTDTSEDGLWFLNSFTGLSSAEKINDVCAYESMTGSQAFSLVAVRVNDAADAKAVAEEMKENIDTRKWICVQADELMVAGYGDVVVLIMLDSGLGLNAQSFVDAFEAVAGAELDFII